MNAAQRSRDLEALAGGAQVDVLVVGGGITGAGVALDAASRGLSVALLERGDLATGTSRWSSKLVHGGLRYLATGQVGVAWESARERGLLLRRIAPHLVSPLPFVIPLGERLNHRKGAETRVGLALGDGLRAASGVSGRDLPRTGRISAHEARALVPGLRTGTLRGALLQWDGRLEDDARLVVAVARTAEALGARVVTRARVTALHGDGAAAVDELTGTAFQVRARHVVNATGVWAQSLAPDVQLRPSRGAHLVLDAAALGHPRAAVNVPVPGLRGRWVFAIPASDGLVVAGITDDEHDGPPEDAPRPTAADEAFLREALAPAFAGGIPDDAVVGRYAGLRPLLHAEGATHDVSRRHAILQDAATGALTLVGGKLTTYRRMAQDAVDRLTDVPCRTATLPLLGAAGPRPTAARDAAHERLLRRFGTEAGAVAALAAERPALLEPLAPGVPALGVEVLWARERELALTAEDVLDRRLRLDLHEARRAAAAERVGELLAEPAPAASAA
ncbi:glycerol-3-phosphate dehydrogenase/oxidase [Conexibacter sp. SYSU D00693]|uniref:glycerol-3-phosphate dehydrogenase/oxidase n=1 Tax=Conexibacter sp. SYSU D00693 TaxID=2812560 RepID=UPI00196A9D63|nr:glycerol-3-phosphate dehydrogenase/oxidase [Conexibacter sp. SYSU D00693]